MSKRTEQLLRALEISREEILERGLPLLLKDIDAAIAKAKDEADEQD